MNQMRHRLNHNSDSSTQKAHPEIHHDSRTQYERKISKPIEFEGRLMSCLRRAYRRWSLIRPLGRLALTLAACLVSFHIIIGLLNAFGSHYGPLDRESSSYPRASSSNSTFALAINTYKRPDMLRSAVLHYADRCGTRYRVGQVFVLWAEEDAIPPDPDELFAPTGFRGREDRRQTIPKHENRAPTIVIQLPQDSLNARFLPLDEWEGSAVFMVDDDVRVSCSSLLHAFHAWEAFPDAMVGYYPRLASPPRIRQQKADIDFVYYSWPTVFSAQEFNLVLTKACFLHHKYLEIYSGESHPQEIRDYVDEHKNCEDIAMAMLVANVTKANGGAPEFPVYVEGSVSDKGLFGGISTGAGHMTTRSSCLVDLTRIYHERSWSTPLSETVSLQKNSWLRHFPGYWWQSRPSNIFEWFAIENIFM